ncbi:MAG: VWA domain-containing protein [Deltaproteobacteria bacterium]|nr:VWA domain-containing protein [Deltaproteobacteria bacterium]
MKRNRRTVEIFSLSFLDVVSCGFGAIVLILVISKISQPVVVENVTVDLTHAVAQLESDNSALYQDSSRLSARLQDALGEEERLDTAVKKLQSKMLQLQDKQQAARVSMASQSVIIKQLYSARQSLTEEMRRLQAIKPVQLSDSVIGGVPVDSEYIIFVIDTSGSMQQYAWSMVRKKMREILEIYPHVKGIQVMNDMGDYMFSQYSGRWIRDSPARRKAILARLRNWTPFSNSSPVEGITAAIKRFYATDKKISIYIFGDDFSRGSIQSVVDTVDSINRAGHNGARRVRIHAVGFPVLFSQPGAGLNVARFAALMRRLAEDNDGSFVGLTHLK